MAGPKDIRRLAFQALFQLDARQGGTSADLAGWLDDLAESENLSPKDKHAATEQALAAYAHRAKADAAMAKLAPAWPAHRQAAVDRAILRLAYHEMFAGHTPPKVVVNEAVQLAKEFSTERSPAFINGLLDKVLKEVLAAKASAESTPAPGQAGDSAGDAGQSTQGEGEEPGPVGGAG
jgi:N utilization substance protein B